MAEDELKSKTFEGFSSPNYTQVPDALFDYLLPDLSEIEIKVLLYIIRRTFGFKKDSDNISLRQLSEGITTKDGKQLDRGTGLSKSGVTKALLSLRKKGILIRYRNSDTVRGSTPTTYRLRMAGDPLDNQDEVPDVGDYPLSTGVDTPVHRRGHPLSTGIDTPVHGGRQPLSTGVDTQETVKQQTEVRERDLEFSNGRVVRINYSETRRALQPYIEDFAREFGDEAKLSSSLSRAVNLCDRSGLDIDEFIDVLLAARAKTKEKSASISKQAGDGGMWGTKKNRMPYWFKIVEDMLGLKDQQSG